MPKSSNLVTSFATWNHSDLVPQMKYRTSGAQSMLQLTSINVFIDGLITNWETVRLTGFDHPG